MDVVIDPNSATPPFEQLRSALASDINSGTLAVGTKLPTVRALAEQLDLAANTVARAYRELEAAGLLDTRGRAGTFVASSGDVSRHKLQRAAATYAAVARDLGIGPDEALAVVRAALGN